MISRQHARRWAVPVARLAGAAVIIGLATAVFVLLRPIVDFAVIGLLYLFPVGLTALVWGTAPGWWSGLLAIWALDYFFVPPLHSLGISQPSDVVLVAALAAITAAGAPLLSRARAGLRALSARQRELTHLYELMTALARVRNEEAVARAVAAHLQEATQARAVEVVHHPAPRQEPRSWRVPDTATVPVGRPDVILPLMTPRGLQGEIHVWTGGAAVGETTDRLLKTAASQAALAFEREALAQSETRAKVFEESDRLKSVLLSSVSHELRTPLSTIKAAVSSLRSGAVRWDTPAREELLAAVEEETDRLNALVGHLLDMTRIEAGALHLQRRWNVMADLVAEAVAQARRSGEGHRLAVDVPDDLPLVPVDDVQIRQVFVNLLDNSFKYAPPGTVVGVTARIQGDELVATVANQGPTVPTEELERIFDKFHRITFSDRVTGTGLGLSICKGIVEAHGGRLWAENLAPGGPYSIAFHCALPLSPAGFTQPRIPAEADRPGNKQAEVGG